MTQLIGGGPSPIATNEMLTIGAFSKRSRLSLKALRLYDEMGLLRPAAVDPSNGYRYYGEDQLVLARLIGLLRRLEVPLAQIAEVVALDGDAAIKSVGTYWKRVETDLRTKRRLVRYLIGYLSGKGANMAQIPFWRGGLLSWCRSPAPERDS